MNFMSAACAALKRRRGHPGDVRAVLNGSLALCRDERRADFIRNIMECSSREALTFDIFSSDPDSPRVVRGRKLERAAYESCVGKSLRKMGWEEYMSFSAWR